MRGPSNKPQKKFKKGPNQHTRLSEFDVFMEIELSPKNVLCWAFEFDIRHF